MKEEKQYKTPAYVRRAVNKYRDRFDVVTVRLPKGYAEAIRRTTGGSVAGYIAALVTEDLRRRDALPPEGD